MEGAAKLATRWHNHVPPWVWTHPALQPKRGSGMSAARAAAIIQGMANRGDVDSAGNITHILGGKQLAVDLGVSPRSLEIYLAHFIEHGVLVLLSRGGVVYDGPKARNASNVYGIPIRPGSLDHRSVRRREQVMRPTGKRDRLGRPAFSLHVIEAGAQSTLWPQRRRPTPREAGYAEPGQQRLDLLQQQERTPLDNGAAAPSESPPTPIDANQQRFRPVCKAAHQPAAQATERNEPLDNGPAGPSDHRSEPGSLDRGRRTVSSDLPPPLRYPPVTVALPPRNRYAPPLTMEPSPLYGQNHGARTLREHGSEPSPGDLRAARASAKAGRPPIRHIDDAGILRDDRRLKDLWHQERRRRATSATPLQWFGAAERALRVTHEEGGDPVALFAHLVNTESWSYVSEEDEAGAARRLEACQMSPDAKVALAACQVARRSGQDPLTLMRLQRKITRDQWQRLLDELRRHGYETAL